MAFGQSSGCHGKLHVKLSLNFSALSDLANLAYVHQVYLKFGEEGIQALQVLIPKVREVYEYLEPELCNGRITVFRRLTAREGLGPDDRVLPRSQDIKDYADSGFVLEVAHDGSLIIKGQPPNADLPLDAVVYEFEAGAERFLAGDGSYPIPDVFPGFASLFAIPTFTTLSEALDDYRLRIVRHSHCKILERCWVDAKNRLFVQAGHPEADMRNSLYAFLQATLRDAEVRPEQNVDESHPVDIKVTFHEVRRMALIEIKWMGDSLAADGHVTAQHRDGRAHEGAKQLAEYLDANQPFVPNFVVVGYLYVIDARRRGLVPGGPSPSREDAFYFVDKDVTYAPPYHEFRLDFQPPIRAFVEPGL